MFLAAAGGTLFLAGLAAAASLAVSGDRLGAGSASLVSCDADGAGGLGGGTITDYVVDGSNRVSSVTLAGLDADCAGGALTITLTDQSGTVVGSGTVASTATPSQTVTVSGTGPDADTVAHVRVEVVGP